MKTFIFTGPTLSADVGEKYLEATYLPPVAQGDVYSISRENPVAIGIIDGYFERVPAVWHKEILWAMEQGIHVFGSASMGALRAAELADFGMQGVGSIFEAYYDGTLEHDDEVVLVHGPAEAGYPAGSEALINIRFTLAAADKVNIIDSKLHYELIRIAQNIHYRQRTYTALLQTAEQQGFSVQILRDWLSENRINQKRLDAITMLQQMREFLASDPGHKEVDFRFQHTDAWETLRRTVEQRPSAQEQIPETFSHDAVIEELRLQNIDYRLERQTALAREFALEIAAFHQFEVGTSLFQQSAAAFCWRNNIAEPGQVETWMQQQQLEWSEFTDLMEQEAKVYRINSLFEPELDSALTGLLRATGRYHTLSQRSLEKQRLLAEHGLENPNLVDLPLSEAQLWAWFFQQHLDIKPPDDLELYAQQRDFTNLAELRRAVMREWSFLRLTGQLQGLSDSFSCV